MKNTRLKAGSQDALVRRWKREAIELRKELSAVNLQLANRTQYAKLIAVSMAKHWSDTSPNFRPFDDLGGLLSQIDNMASGMERKRRTPPRRRIAGFWRGDNNTVLVELECGHSRLMPQRRKKRWSGGFKASLLCHECQSPNAVVSDGSQPFAPRPGSERKS